MCELGWSLSSDSPDLCVASAADLTAIEGLVRVGQEREASAGFARAAADAEVHGMPIVPVDRPNSSQRRSATASAPDASQCGSISANSSPPKRAGTSSVRDTCCGG